MLDEAAVKQISHADDSHRQRRRHLNRPSTATGCDAENACEDIVHAHVMYVLYLSRLPLNV
jgi:hypothetical protein